MGVPTHFTILWKNFLEQSDCTNEFKKSDSTSEFNESDSTSDCTI